MRQERDGAFRHAPGGRPARTHRRRQPCVSTGSTSSASIAAAMRQVRGKEISMIFQEPMTSLNPVMTIGRQISEALMLHGAASRAATRRAHARDAGAGRHPGPGAADQGIPAPALRGHAPARHDRHGAGLQPQSADRRRANLGARRNGPGADPGADGEPAAQARHGRDPDHPRPGGGGRDRRPGDRHVRRAQGRGGGGRGAVRASPASLHPRADELDPAARPDAARGGVGRPAAGNPGDRYRRSANLPAGCTFAPRCAFASDICRREYPRYEEKRSGHWAACWHSDRLAGAANG